MNDIEDLPHLICVGFAQDERSADVGLIAFDGATAVNHKDGAFPKNLRGGGSVGQGGIFVDLHAGAARISMLGIGGLRPGLPLAFASCLPAGS